jgi:flagellar biosynthesis GTPase FlhF
MEAELDVLGGLLKKAALLPRSVPPGVKADARIAAAKRQPEAPSAAKARNNSTTSKPAPEVTKQSTQPKKQHPVAVQRAAPRTAKSSMASLINKAKEVKEKQELELEEIARAREEIAWAREKFRQELLEVEKKAMPDETIYPEVLKGLGISEYEVTPTKKQAARLHLARA